MSTHDVIVVGGGLSGGLPAAAYLQKSGLDVLVVEANSEVGCFCCSHETWAGTLDSPHVGVSFAGNSPVIEDWRSRSTAFASARARDPRRDVPRRTNCLICRSLPGPPRTRRHSERDGRRMLGIQERVHETMVEFNELCSFSPHPDPRSSTNLRDLRVRDGLRRRPDVADDGSGAVRADIRVRRLPPDADDPVAFWEHGAPFARGQGAYG